MARRVIPWLLCLKCVSGAVVTVIGAGCAPAAPAVPMAPEAPADPGMSEPEPPAAALEIGVTGDGVYRALSEGDPLAVHRGSQGGIHVFVSLRLAGFPLGETFLVTSEGVMLDTAEENAPTVTLSTSFQPTADGINERVDYRIVLNGTRNTYRDRQGRLTLTVTDSQDETVNVSASVIVTFVDAP